MAQKRLCGHTRDVIDIKKLIWCFVPITKNCSGYQIRTVKSGLCGRDAYIVLVKEISWNWMTQKKS